MIKRGDWIKYTVSYWEGDVRKTSTVLAQVFSSTRLDGLGTITGSVGMRYNFRQDGTAKEGVTGVYSNAEVVPEEEKAERGITRDMFWCETVRLDPWGR